MNCTTRQSAFSLPFQSAQRALQRRFDASTSDVGAMTIVDGKSRTHFEFDVPGFNSDEITIDLQDGRLLVSGELTNTECPPPVYSERHSKSFRRLVRLGSKLDPATADAELKDGVLRLSFARKPEADRRRIEIRNTTEAF